MRSACGSAGECARRGAKALNIPMNSYDSTKNFVTFADYGRFWLASKIDTKPTTRACYQSLLEFAAAPFHQMPVEEITRADIMNWMMNLIHQHGYGSGHIRAAHRVVYSTLALAHSLGAISVNPAADVSLPQVHSQSPRVDRRLTVEQLEALAREIGWWNLVPHPNSGIINGEREPFMRVKGKSGFLSRRENRYGNRRELHGAEGQAVPPCEGLDSGNLIGMTTSRLRVNQLEVLILILGYCGLRIGEALALTWGDIDWNQRSIRINHAFSEVSGHLVLGSPKNGKRRTVPIPSFLTRGGLRRLRDYDALAILSRHKTPFPEAGIHGVNPTVPDSRLRSGRMRQMHLFRTAQGNPLRASNLRFHFALAAVAIGETGLHIHDLRHTAASLAVSAGANVKALAQILGHSSAAMTLDVYADLFAEDLSEVAVALNRLRERRLRAASRCARG